MPAGPIFPLNGVEFEVVEQATEVVLGGGTLSQGVANKGLAISGTQNSFAGGAVKSIAMGKMATGSSSFLGLGIGVTFWAQILLAGVLVATGVGIHGYLQKKREQP